MDFERLVNRHKDAVYRQLIRTCGNWTDAEDALADALLAALKASDSLKDPANFQAWLARIGTRACARMRIRQRLTQFTSLTELESKGFEMPDDGPDPELTAELSAMKTCVSGALELLPPIYRDVYMRREISGDSAEEVARSLGLTIPAVKSRLYRAREMMREALDSGLGCRNLLDDTD